MSKTKRKRERSSKRSAPSNTPTRLANNFPMKFFFGATLFVVGVVFASVVPYNSLSDLREAAILATTLLGIVALSIFLGALFPRDARRAWRERIARAAVKVLLQPPAPPPPPLRITVATQTNVANVDSYRTAATTTVNAELRIDGDFGNVISLGDELIIERERLGPNAKLRLKRDDITDVTIVDTSVLVHTAERPFVALTHASNAERRRALLLLRAWWAQELDEGAAREIVGEQLTK